MKSWGGDQPERATPCSRRQGLRLPVLLLCYREGLQGGVGFYSQGSPMADSPSIAYVSWKPKGQGGEKKVATIL